MRLSTVLATGCLTLISVWQAADGRYVWAGVFIALALGNLGLAVWSGRGRAAAAPAPHDLDVEREKRVRAGWLRITLFGWIAAVAGAFVFPPMSLVLAGLSMYATVRYRRSGMLIAAAERSGDAPQTG
ncbi:MAG: hypothetical protein GEV11_06615 [Streptosporangiales bacterium]|nr:hypothetical protein [Streptosporangiales bacterium]